MTFTPHTYAFGGGLDVASAALAVPPGRVISGMNYEPLAEGYGRVHGFERYDGRKAPSTAQFWTLQFVSGHLPFAIGAVVTGATSGASAIVAHGVVDFFGEWADGTGRGVLVLTGMGSTEFVAGEELRVGGVPHATTSSASMIGQAAGGAAQAIEYLGAAQEYWRSLIGRVPGAGPVRGVHVFKGEVFAWRDSTVGAFARMYRKTNGGWVEVILGKVIQFSAGTAEMFDGSIITGATSGATATAARVVRNAGDWGSTASGYMVLTNLVGAFSVGEKVKVGGVNMATAGATSNITLPQGGRYMGINHNFYGAANRYRAYIVNGVGPAFEFDGATVVPIYTGMPQDQPTRIFEIANHLGLCFPGGSVQISSIGEPVLFDAVQGAAEIGLGTEITDVLQSAETAVILFGQEKIGVLSGTDSQTFQLQELTEEAGAYPWTAQSIGKRVYLDARGLRDVTSTSSYGNFKAGLLSEIIEPYFRAKREAGVKPVLSYVCRAKSHYRLLWDDRTGLTVYLGRKAPEAMPFTTDDVDFTCVSTGEMDDGEGMFAGAQDGYVYRLDSGGSFDGNGVSGFIMTPFNHLGSVSREKNLRKTEIELKAETIASIGVSVWFNYGEVESPRSGQQDSVIFGSGGIWDISTVWDRFYWSAPIFGRLEVYTEGQGTNMAAIIVCESKPAETPHILQAYTLYTLARRSKR